MAITEAPIRRPDVSEFDELVAADGVLVAGRFGPDGRVAEYKADAWYIENPAVVLPDAQNERDGVAVDERGASAIRSFRRAGCS
jgi:hypothetical protein